MIYLSIYSLLTLGVSGVLEGATACAEVGAMETAVQNHDVDAADRLFCHSWAAAPYELELAAERGYLRRVSAPAEQVNAMNMWIGKMIPHCALRPIS